MLQPLGGRFARKWEGAWITLYSDSPDRVSQASGSARELIIQILAHLAPDSSFTREEIARDGENGRVTRRMRVRRIISGAGSRQASAWVEKTADALCAMHDSFVAAHHNREELDCFNEADLAAALMTVGGLLEFVIGRYGRSTSLMK
jgi:hypothetical protein